MALACAGVLMIQRGAHSWLTAPHPSVAFSISVRPNGIRSVIIRLFTVHAGLTVNFWDMRPLSSSNLFFSELRRRFISPFWRLVCRARPQTGTLCLCSGSFHGFWSQTASGFWSSFRKREKKGTFYLQTVFDHTFMGLAGNWSDGDTTFKFFWCIAKVWICSHIISRHINDTAHRVIVDRKDL